MAAESLLAGVFFIYQRYQSIGGDQLTMRVRLLASIASLTCHLFGSGECCAKGADDSVEVNFSLSVGLLIDVQCLACLWKDRVAVEAGRLEFFAAHAMQLYSIVLGLVTSWFSSVRLADWDIDSTLKSWPKTSVRCRSMRSKSMQSSRR